MIIGGAQENTLLNCLDLIREHGDDVVLLTGPAIGPEGDLLSQGRAGELEVRMLPHLRREIHPWRDYQARNEIRTSLRKFQPDVVHTHSAKGGLLGRYVGWSLKVPAVIHTVHGAPFHPYQPAPAREFFRRCERWAATKCHRMISVADAMTDLMVDSGVAPREKFRTIYSGMNVDPFLKASEHRQTMRAKYGIGNDHIVIGKIARLFHLKGHEDLVAAAAQVVESNPRVRFLLVGDGILRDQLKHQISSLGLDEHFIFAGLVPPSEVPRLIGAMDILVHTSYREGLARALPQALIAGLPVVSYDVDGAREVTVTDETGILVPPRQVDQLAAALAKLAADQPWRQQLGRAGQRRFTDQFRHQTMTRLIREQYEQVLGRESR
ncbi:MAG: glycosyltransferase family 4 protein [Rubripirellula sp.]